MLKVLKLHDGTLKDVDFKNIDELIAKLNKLPAQTDEYAKTLEEIIPIWEEIKIKVDAVEKLGLPRGIFQPIIIELVAHKSE